jgi:hypothetical protein
MNTSINGSQKADGVPEAANPESENRKAWESPKMLRFDVSAAGATPNGHGNDSVFNYS